MSSNLDRVVRADTPGVLVPVPQDPRALGLTYEPFFGLREKPFSLTSDARFFYQSRSHAPAFDDLLNAVRRRESLNVLTGDIGTGKTTLCRAVLNSLDRKTFSAFVPDPFASREDLLKILLIDFGVVSIDDVTSGRLRQATRTELSYLLYEFLGTLAPLQAFAVVFIDEAQNLSIPLLEETRILSDADGQLQVVLVGQLELREKLKLPEMRQLHQRISVHCQLSPLDLAGVAGYISHRLRQAGGSPDRVKFSGDAVEAIYERSGGVPRIINRLCDRALRHGHARRAATIDREILEAANPASAEDAIVEEAPARPVQPLPLPVLLPVQFAPAPEPEPEPESEPESEPQPEPVPLDVAPAEPAFEGIESAAIHPPSPVVEEVAELEPVAAKGSNEGEALVETAPRPDPLDIWRTEGEPELSPVPSDWRHRWAPTNAVTPEPAPRSGIRSLPLTVRIVIAVAAGFVIVFAALAVGSAFVAPGGLRPAIRELVTPPPMPDAPAHIQLPQPRPLQLPDPPPAEDLQ